MFHSRPPDDAAKSYLAFRMFSTASRKVVHLGPGIPYRRIMSIEGVVISSHELDQLAYLRLS